MKKICVFLADGFEEIEGLTVVDLCRRAGIEVTAASITDDVNVNGAHGIKVLADTCMKDVDFDAMDAIVLPGGQPGTRNLGASDAVKEVVCKFAESGRLTCAICAAPSVFANLGLLTGKKATVYPGCEVADTAEWTGEPVVKTGQFITGRGPGVAIQFAIRIVEELLGKEIAAKIYDGLQCEGR